MVWVLSVAFVFSERSCWILRYCLGMQNREMITNSVALWLVILLSAILRHEHRFMTSYFILLYLNQFNMMSCLSWFTPINNVTTQRFLHIKFEDDILWYPDLYWLLIPHKVNYMYQIWVWYLISRFTLINDVITHCNVSVSDLRMISSDILI